MNGPLTVVIADDHPLFRKGLTDVLRDEPGIRVVGEAANGGAALAAVRAQRPRIAVLDIEMPGSSGLAVAGSIRDEGLGTESVILTMYRDGGMLRRARDVGVKGYVLKDSALDEIVACLHMVGAGRTYTSPALSSPHLEETGSPMTEISAVLRTLTPAERRVLKLIAQGMTTVDIAHSLGNSPRTIENHRAHISRKLDLSGPQAVLRFALERKTLLE